MKTEMGECVCVCVCVCVCMRPCMHACAPIYPAVLNGDLVVWCQQPTQLNRYLVLTGEANANRPCLTQRVKVQVGLQVPTVGHGTASCGLLVLPQKDFPALTHST